MAVLNAPCAAGELRCGPTTEKRKRAHSAPIELAGACVITSPHEKGGGSVTTCSLGSREARSASSVGGWRPSGKLARRDRGGRNGSEKGAHLGQGRTGRRRQVAAPSPGTRQRTRRLCALSLERETRKRRANRLAVRDREWLRFHDRSQSRLILSPRPRLHVPESTPGSDAAAIERFMRGVEESLDPAVDRTEAHKTAAARRPWRSAKVLADAFAE